jgi:hypothetical protein
VTVKYCDTIDPSRILPQLLCARCLIAKGDDEGSTSRRWRSKSMTRKYAMARRADDYAWHAAKIRKGIQQLLADGDAARTEWGCKIICRQPLVLRIDGHDYQWPMARRDDADD